MNRLTIDDLSFCETEFNNTERVKGGMSISDVLSSYYSPYADSSFPIANSDLKLAEQSLAKDGYQARYYYDDATGDFVMVASQEYGSGTAFSRVSKSYVSNGRSVNAFALAAV